MNEQEAEAALKAFQERLPEGSRILAVEWREFPPKVLVAIPLEKVSESFNLKPEHISLMTAVTKPNEVDGVIQEPLLSQKKVIGAVKKRKRKK